MALPQSGLRETPLMIIMRGRSIMIEGRVEGSTGVG
jgi:hypothetical protein